MTSFTVPAGACQDAVFDHARQHLAAAASLARFNGVSREHTDSDVRAFLSWCAGRGIEPLRAQRAQLEWYVRWMQKTRRRASVDNAASMYGSYVVTGSRGKR
jgi:hypothetical protein